jgi:hypothetical protein
MSDMKKESTAHVVGNGDAIAVFMDADMASRLSDEILAMRLVIGMAADSDASTSLLLAMALRSAAQSEDPVSHRLNLTEEFIDGRTLLKLAYGSKTVDAD